MNTNQRKIFYRGEEEEEKLGCGRGVQRLKREKSFRTGMVRQPGGRGGRGGVNGGRKGGEGEGGGGASFEFGKRPSMCFL